MEALASTNVRLIEQLVETHGLTIRRFIARRSGSEVLKRVTIDDLFQETVTAACASAGTFEFRDDGSFVAWISTIARRVIARCATGSRREPYTIRIKRAESTGVGVRESEFAPGGRTPSSLAAAQELETALRAAIRRLPPDYHRVITLYKIEERPLSEVAELMDRTKGATCRLIARAVQQLRMTMVNDEHIESL